MRTAHAGFAYGVAVRHDGSVVEWGHNAGGQAIAPIALSGVISVAVDSISKIALYRNSKPSFSSHPANQSVVEGGYVVLSASAAGTIPLFYQWTRDGVDLADGESISGATTPTLVLDPIYEPGAGSYRLRATNSKGATLSDPAVVTVKVPARFVQRPLSRIVTVGNSIVFDGTATDAETVSYQWKHNGQTISGATGPTLSLAAVSYSDRGFYEVIASNSVASNWSSFSIIVAPGNTEALAVESWGGENYGDPGEAGGWMVPAGLGDVVSVTAGPGAGVALRKDGTIRAWGQTDRFGVENFDAVSNVVAVAVGYDHVLALLADGRVSWFGSNGNQPPPLGLRNVVAVAATWSGSVALKSDGTVVTWGIQPPPAGLNSVVSMAAGSEGVFAVKSDGTVVGWATGAESFAEVPAGLSDVQSIAAGSQHVLALKTNGSVVAWGQGQWSEATIPADLSNLTAIAAGPGISVALKSDGSARAWGNDAFGQSGTRPELIPIAMMSPSAGYSLVLTAALLPPVFDKQPEGMNVFEGDELVLEVNSSGRPTPTFQWQKDGIDIPGATGPSLITQSAQLADAGLYRVVASNSVGTAVSEEVQVAVTPTVATPEILPSDGRLAAGQPVAIICATPGASIRYTTNGQTPTETFGILYEGPFDPVQSGSIVAFAYKEGMGPSNVLHAAIYVYSNSVPKIISANVPRGVVGISYSVHMEATGGDQCLIWSLVSGQLPTGLTLSSDGVISGVPTSQGTWSFVLRVADGDSFSEPFDEGTIDLVITVDATDSVPVITTTSLPDAGLSLAYLHSIAVSGGNGPLTWTLASGSLPPGLTLSEGGLITGIPQALGTRTFTVRVGDDDTITGPSDESTKELSITVVPAPRLTNVSMRAFAGAGDNTLVVGFHIAGTGLKTVLIRGVGPKLLDYNVPSVVADPSITLFKDLTVLATNNDWNPLLAPTFLDAGAFALDFGSKDAAMTATLGPGGYTIHLVNNGPIAEGLIEVYDISRDAGSRLVNVSSRLRFQPGQLAILGTAVTGGPITVLARNVGPGIAEYLVNPLDALPDPHLKLYTGQTMMSENEDWDPALLPFFGSAGAFTIDEGSKDAAIRAQFQIGGYTVHSTGNGGEGVAIIEIYESP
ncbi:MAG TPA: immunoglobulin domain-containing protein [Rhodothermales bacterium]|nr:immunoglobulin domain-containing protein [Rhodothermales bacterium]